MTFATSVSLRDTMNIPEDSPAKEQNPVPASELTERYIKKMGDTEFKTLVTKLIDNT